MPEDGRILIVDDDEEMRVLLQKVLVRQGYQVVAAGSGEEALQRMAAQPCDLVLTDIRMPGMDGMALLGQVHRVAPEATVIMMTAFGTVHSAVEAMKQGAYHYISKPFKMDEVLIVLSRATLEELEKDYILLVLEQTAGHQTKAAEILGIDRRTLYRKLHAYGLEENAPQETDPSGQEPQ